MEIAREKKNFWEVPKVTKLHSTHAPPRHSQHDVSTNANANRFFFVFSVVVTGCPRAVRQIEALCSKCGAKYRKCKGVKDVRDGLPGPARN